MKRKQLLRGKKALICITLSVTGLFSGYHLTRTGYAVTKSRFEQLELFNKVLYLIESQYYREVDSKKLIEGAVKGMMETLDPHSAFLPEELFQKMQQDTSGEFEGIGIEVTQKDGYIYIITPIEDSPADKAGLLPADRIVEINHESTLGMTLNQAIDQMKGKPGTNVHVGILRDGEEGIIYKSIERKVIKVKSVKSEIIQDNYLFVRLTSFQKNAGRNIRRALNRMEKQVESKGGVRGVILDLRGNPGGLLNEAVEVSSLFLEKGIVVSTEGRDPKDKEIRYVSKSGKKWLKTPLTVLINSTSASASEIVSGALQDHNRAVVMGQQSFGKGSVQSVAKIDGKNGLKLTISQYMTPKGRKIQAIGIQPDIVLEELEGPWLGGKDQDNVVREKDLKNHLTATIETEKEKNERLAREKAAKKKRLAEINAKNKNKKKVKPTLFKRKDFKTDFQVIQAINYMKAYEVLQRKIN